MPAPHFNRVTILNQSQLQEKNVKQIIEKSPDVRVTLEIFAVYSRQLPFLKGASSYFGFANECAIRTDSSSPHAVGPVPLQGVHVIGVNMFEPIPTMFVKQSLFMLVS